VPLYLKEQDAADLVDMPSVVTALRATFAAQARGEAVNVPRSRYDFWERRLNVMGGGMRESRRYAIKAYGGATYHILLYSVEQGLLAVCEAGLLGQIRTGAASGVATALMARPDAGRVGIIGAGRHARTQALALKAVDRLTEVAVHARNRENLIAFCFTLAEELGAPVRVAETAQDAVNEADIVVTATTSSQPVLRHEWLAAGVHVNAMGANAANRRELDPEIVRRASLVVTDDVEQAKLEAAEFIDLAREGGFDWAQVRNLYQLVGAGAPVRPPGALTLFKSLGAGLEDLAISSLLYDRAVASGKYKPL
jgi:alanine dehydrogenase